MWSVTASKSKIQFVVNNDNTENQTILIKKLKLDSTGKTRNAKYI